MAELWGRSWTRDELRQRVGDIGQLAGVRRSHLSDGRASGVEQLEVYNGRLSFKLLPGRALDIGACRFDGRPLAFSAPVGEVHSAYYEPQGSGWLRSFSGGLMVTCGLDQFGRPSETEGGKFGLHGRISNLPTDRVAYGGRWVGDDYEIEVSGVVRQANLFGENLVLERKVTTWLGTTSIKVEDTVRNEGFRDQPHMLLYHCNLGFPLIDEGAELVLDSRETVAANDEAQAGLADWGVFHEPRSAYREQVFRHDLIVDERGTAEVRVRNPEVGLELVLRYSANALPVMYQWKMLGQGEYVLGLEPANCDGLAGRGAALDRGVVPVLAPGEERSYLLQFEVTAT